MGIRPGQAFVKEIQGKGNIFQEIMCERAIFGSCERFS